MLKTANPMMPFEDWWGIVISTLDNPRKIRNWTPYNGYTVGGQFVARSYRSLTREEQSSWNDGYPFSVPDDWIVHTQVKGKELGKVSKKEFKDRYGGWRAYRDSDNKIIRKDFDGKTKASPYLISVFHAFDSLMSGDVDDPTALRQILQRIVSGF
jgi:hypothetical protein